MNRNIVDIPGIDTLKRRGFASGTLYFKDEYPHVASKKKGLDVLFLIPLGLGIVEYVPLDPHSSLDRQHGDEPYMVSIIPLADVYRINAWPGDYWRARSEETEREGAGAGSLPEPATAPRMAETRKEEPYRAEPGSLFGGDDDSYDPRDP